VLRLSQRSIPPVWLVGTVASIFVLQVAVTLARPVSTYRLLALGADGVTLGLTAACFAVPPMLLAVGFGRWTEQHHPALLLVVGLGVSSVAAFVLVFAQSILAMALATTALGVGHMSGIIGGQSIMAQAHSSLARIDRFGTLTTVSALGQIVGPVLGGVIIGHTEEPSLASTSSALWVAAWVFVAGVPAAALAMRTRIQASTVRTGRAERIWHLLRRRGMPAALMTSFSAKSGIDLLLVYVPLLGAVVGLTSSQVGILLGISSSGALVARAATPFFVRRIPNLRLTVVATVVAASCLLVVASSHNWVPMIAAMSVLGFALGLSQTTTMDWVVNLVDDTSRGSALGLRVATNRVGQTFVLAVAGAVSGAWGVQAAFALLAAVMFVTAAAGVISGRRGQSA
jgi:predicted MFS family arabinose efflux permease